MSLLAAAAPASAEPPTRIVSLAPNLTELLFSLGLGDRVVGVTTFCDHPSHAQALPKVGGMSNPSLESIVRLKPDLVLITTDGNPKWVQDRLAVLGIRTYLFAARRLHELPSAIEGLGAALGAEEAARHLSASLQSTLRAAPNGSPSGRQPRAEGKVLFVIWPDPLIVAGPGTVAADALDLLGRKNAAADALSPYPRFSLEEVIRRSPDVLIIGKGHEDMAKLSSRLIERLEKSGMAKRPRVIFVGDALYRLGPRVIAGIAELSQALEGPLP